MRQDSLRDERATEMMQRGLFARMVKRLASDRRNFPAWTSVE